MKAERLFYDKAVHPDGFIVEMVIWRVATPVPPSSHGLKYSLFYGRDGVRGRETRYRFVSVEKLLADFLAEVEHERNAS